MKNRADYEQADSAFYDLAQDCSQEIEIKASPPPPPPLKSIVGPKLPCLTSRKSSSSQNYIIEKTVKSVVVSICTSLAQVPITIFFIIFSFQRELHAIEPTNRTFSNPWTKMS